MRPSRRSPCSAVDVNGGEPDRVTKLNLCDRKRKFETVVRNRARRVQTHIHLAKQVGHARVCIPAADVRNPVAEDGRLDQGQGLAAFERVGAQQLLHGRRLRFVDCDGDSKRLARVEEPQHRAARFRRLKQSGRRNLSGASIARTF
jgi:hypothetical protein